MVIRMNELFTYDNDNEQIKIVWQKTCKLVCDMLNKQQSTIYTLKEENDILKQKLRKNYIANKQYEELQRLKKENNHLKDDFQYYMNKSGTLETELLRLRKDNKQLKDEIDELKQKEGVLNRIWRSYLENDK